MIEKFIYSLLPAYANCTLGPFKHLLVSLWLKHHASARHELQFLEGLSKAAQAQSLLQPPPDMLHRIRTHLHVLPGPQASRGLWGAWIGGMALILLSFVIFWNILPPGIVLRWTAQGGTPIIFRVYRAEASGTSANFELIREISAKPDAQTYTFQDFLLFPGQEYVYRVEVIDDTGLSTSQTIMSSAMEALPGQMTTLLSLLIVMYGIGLAVQKPGWMPVQTI